MLKILTVIGARPQIIKAAALSRAIRTHYSERILELIVHTGQHYDENMSQVFFDDMGIPAPHYNLHVGSGNHGSQTAAMIVGLEKILVEEQPNAIVLFGDTNSTLAGAIAASKIHIPVVHIEAGLRSFNKAMPEEINRILCDHVSTLLFSPTQAGLSHLINEGIAKEKNPVKASANEPAVFHCGDIMYDNSLHFGEIAATRTDILVRENLVKGKFFLATVHRDNNTDIPERLLAIFEALDSITKSNGMPVVLPLHPRTRKHIALHPKVHQILSDNALIKVIEPASFFEMIELEKNAVLVITDSGGVQKEAFFFEKPCVILRPETEWVELVACGAAILADANKERIISSVDSFLNAELNFPSIFGNGKSAEFMCEKMLQHLS